MHSEDRGTTEEWQAQKDWQQSEKKTGNPKSGCQPRSGRTRDMEHQLEAETLLTEKRHEWEVH
eukprot:7248516-Pyramimonas_sp.AAC.1